MPNGNGVASGGSLNYWDANYTGAGAKTTDGAALSGGLGKLTDGVISTVRWDGVSNAAGTGQYVGWVGLATPNPVITFAFASSPAINEIDIYLDNSGFGGVFAPTAILIDGVSRAFTAPVLGSVGKVAFTNLGLTGNSHTVQLNQVNASSWVFVSEITFDNGIAALPEPGALGLAALGLAGVAATRRRRAR